METKLFYGDDAKSKIIAGANKVANAVKVTLGPKGRNVIMRNSQGIKSTKDGVSVAKSISRLADPVEDMGAQMIIGVAQQTASISGDGTTTATVLAQSMITDGIAAVTAGSNPIDVKKGIDAAVAASLEYLNEISQKIDGDVDKTMHIAKISANNDEELGKIIGETFFKIGGEGLVTIADSHTDKTYVEFVEGVQFSKGYLSHNFITNDAKQTCELVNPLILFCDKTLTIGTDVYSAIKIACADSKRPLFVIAEDIAGEALSYLVVNKIKGNYPICAVAAPGFGNSKSHILQDIAIATGGTIMSEATGLSLNKITLENFGQADKIIISKSGTVIMGGKGNSEKISQRIQQIQSQADTTTEPFERSQIQTRLANLSNSVAVMYVGATTEMELKEKKDRIDDALNATRCAILGGVVPGGGVAYLRCIDHLIDKFVNQPSNSFSAGIEIVIDALGVPARQILMNAGYEKDNDIITAVSRNDIDVDYGFNSKTNEYENFFETGVIDPTIVARAALENAASVSSVVLLTECVVVNE